MTKNELNTACNNHMITTHDALQTLWDNINKGQKKQILKKENIKALFDKYGVKYE